MEFINRAQELKRLERMTRTGKKEMLVLYGRSRLGKTALLREVAAPTRHLVT